MLERLMCQSLIIHILIVAGNYHHGLAYPQRIKKLLVLWDQKIHLVQSWIITFVWDQKLSYNLVEGFLCLSVNAVYKSYKNWCDG